MDSDPLPMLEKSDALQRHEVHGNTQETGFDFRHLPSGAKRIKSMDGKAQKTTIMQSLRDCSKSEMRPVFWVASRHCQPDREPSRFAAHGQAQDFLPSASAGRRAADGDRPRSEGSIE